MPKSPKMWLSDLEIFGRVADGIDLRSGFCIRRSGHYWSAARNLWCCSVGRVLSVVLLVVVSVVIAIILFVVIAIVVFVIVSVVIMIVFAIVVVIIFAIVVVIVTIVVVPVIARSSNIVFLG
jgi:hypothetical protein